MLGIETASSGNGLVTKSASQYSQVVNQAAQSIGTTTSDSTSSSSTTSSTDASTTAAIDSGATYTNADGDTVSISTGLVLVAAHGDGHKGLPDPDVKKTDVATSNTTTATDTTSPESDTQQTPPLTGQSLKLSQTYSQAS